jgi:hypothetical protein
VNQPLPPPLVIPHQHEHLATTAHFFTTVEAMMGMMLQAQGTPSNEVGFVELYNLPDYRKKTKAKLTLLKEVVTEDNVQRAIKDDLFWTQVLRVQHQYPMSGQRNYLILLVGKQKKQTKKEFFCCLFVYEQQHCYELAGLLEL